MSFTDQLKLARKNCKMTQEQAARSLGIDKSTYCGYETGKRKPDVERIKELAALFGVQADTLLEVELNPVRVISEAEFALISKYRSLDDSGKTFVEDVIQREYDRVTSYRGSFTLAANPGSASPEEVSRIAAEAMETLKKRLTD